MYPLGSPFYVGRFFFVYFPPVGLLSWMQMRIIAFHAPYDHADLERFYQWKMN